MAGIAAVRPLRAACLLCISSLLAASLRASVASNSLFCNDQLLHDSRNASYLGNNLLYSLFIAFHFQELFDLSDG